MIIAFTGPSGVGKGYAASRLREAFPAIKEITWSTTRPLRPEEEKTTVQNRKHLPADLFALREKERSVLLAHEAHGHRYGILAEDRPDVGAVYLTEFNVANIPAIAASGWQTVLIGLVPSSIDFLHTRIVDYRRTTDSDEVERRLASARTDLAEMERLRHRFHHILTVTPDNERTIAEDIVSIVRPFISQELS